MKEYKNIIESKTYKNSEDRSRYAADIMHWIDAKYADALKTRDKYMRDTTKEELYIDFVKMHGFPLTHRNEYVSLAIQNEIEHVGRDSGADIFRIYLEVLPGIKLFGLYFLPLGKDCRYPLVICQHGANGTPEYVGSLLENSANYNHMARRFVERGAAVFAPQLLTWNMEKLGSPYDRSKADCSLRQLGGSYTAMEMLLLSRCVDYFVTRPDILPNQIGFCGLSWGGMYALHYGAFDSRIKAVYSSCFFNDRSLFNWPDWSYKNQANTFFDAEVAALIAPRFLFVECGANDPLFLIKPAEEEAKRAQKYFFDEGYEDRFKFHTFIGEHEFNKDDVGINWFMEKLLL